MLVCGLQADMSESFDKVLEEEADNGSNMTKAFSKYEEPAAAIESDRESDSEVQEDVAVTYVSEILCGCNSSDGTTTDCIFLLKHARCASHTLNLVATHDLIVANIYGDEKSLLRSSMAKCSALWNNVSRSTKSADTVYSITHIFAHTWTNSLECHF